MCGSVQNRYVDMVEIEIFRKHEVNFWIVLYCWEMKRWMIIHKYSSCILELIDLFKKYDI